MTNPIKRRLAGFAGTIAAALCLLAATAPAMTAGPATASTVAPVA